MRRAGEQVLYVLMDVLWAGLMVIVDWLREHRRV